MSLGRDSFPNPKKFIFLFLRNSTGSILLTLFVFLLQRVLDQIVINASGWDTLFTQFTCKYTSNKSFVKHFRMFMPLS